MEVTSEIPNLDNYKILPEGGRSSYFYTSYLVNKGWLPKNKKFHLNNVPLCTLNKNHVQKWYLVVKDNQDFDKTLDAFLKNPKLFDELEKYGKDIVKKLVKAIKAKEISSLSSEKLILLFKLFCKQFEKSLPIARGMRFIDRAIIIKLREILKNEPNVDEAVANSCASERLTFPMQEEIALLETAIKIKKENIQLNSNKADKLISHLLDKYAWTTCGYYHEGHRTKEIYLQKLNDLIKENPQKHLEEIKSRLNESIKKRDVLIRKYSNSADIIKIAGLAGYFKDYYKSTNNEIVYYGESLFQEISKRTDKPIEFLKDLHPNELIDLINGKSVDESKIVERVKRYALLNLGNKFFVLSGREAEEFEAKYLKSEEINRSEFKGRAASRGYAKGRAKIVLNQKEFNKMEKGDILVVINTSPDFVPIMKKASAIIADEGGLTSHTSVVSREFGIPCIVGIHNITNMLKDNDLIEVDANKGTVKVLEKAK